MIIKEPILTTSESYKWLIRDIERFGNNYRHRHNGKFYKVIEAKPGARNEVILSLESVI